MSDLPHDRLRRGHRFQGRGILGEPGRTTCKACHGPGSKHEEACKPFLNKKTLSPDELKIAHGTIYKVQPRNVCIACHTIQGHKAHPNYDQQ